MSKRLGSPSSIPSSPASVHSSSSAIFERDIEPISPPTSAHSPNPHRIPRSKATEQIDQSLPSVLDSAAEILTANNSQDDADSISVVAPAHNPHSGLTSPIGSIRSRSPSPPATRPIPIPTQRSTLLLSIPSPTQQQLQHPVANLPNLGTPAPYAGPVVPPTAAFPQTAAVTNATSPTFPPNVLSPPSPRPLIQTSLDVDPDLPSVTPTSTYYSTASSVDDSASTRDAPPLPAPPSPTNPATCAPKRLSFMSYADLLASTPESMHPLSSLTTSASSEPPPHIPGVSGVAQLSALAGPAREDGTDDIAGEWEREGLGKGLEERLEALMVGRA